MQRLVEFIDHDRPVGIFHPLLAQELTLAVAEEFRLGDAHVLRQLMGADELIRK